MRKFGYALAFLGVAGQALAAPCHVSRVAVVQQAVVATQVLTPQAIFVPSYTMTYNGGYGQQRQALTGEDPIIAAIDRLTAAVERLSANGGIAPGQAVQVNAQAVFTAKCASCHQDGKADKSGMVLMEKDGKISVFSLAEKRRILDLVDKGLMPPAEKGPLDQASKDAIKAYLSKN